MQLCVRCVLCANKKNKKELRKQKKRKKRKSQNVILYYCIIISLKMNFNRGFASYVSLPLSLSPLFLSSRLLSFLFVYKIRFQLPSGNNNLIMIIIITN